MEQVILCLVIDDERLGQDLIEKYINRLPSLKLLAKVDNAIEALDYVDRMKPALIFLDVNMPEMTGIEFIRTFNSYKPQIVLITAYSEYAVSGYEYDVADFLLKPVTFERFAKAVNKVKERLRLATTGFAPASEDPALEKTAEPETADPGTVTPIKLENRQLLIKENKKFLNIFIDDIYIVEGMKDYLKIHTKSKMIITHMTMGKMEETLPENEFLRINRSFIVRKSAVKTVNGNTIELLNNLELPVGIKYRDIIKGLLDKGSL